MKKIKYCPKCGAELLDEAVVCPKCGCATEEFQKETKKEDKSQLREIAKIFMIICCVISGFCYLIPLCWTVPMTVSYCNKLKNGEKVSTAFKVCSLLFVSLIAGILMLCDDDL